MKSVVSSSPPVTVIIVAWNQLEKTLACLTTVAALDYPAVRVLLVDNGSEPPLAEAIAARFPTVEMLRLPTNLGFAGGYNAGLRRAMAGDGRYFLLLNNDTLVAPDVVTHLVAELETMPDVGLATAKIYYAAEPNRIWTVGANLNVFLDLKDGGQGQIDAGQWAAPRDVDFAPFCAILIRREVIAGVGLLDEAFFLYYEDMDYCRRARAVGWRIRLRPDAHVRHDVSASSGGRDSPMERYYMAESGGRYFRKHGRGPRLLLIVPFRLFSALKMTGHLLLAGKGEALRAYWRGLRVGWMGDGGRPTE
ncbi:glycosyltransferase family 2 protein [Candidatus Promineifilum breve]|uniref:glycosyltransferase family 2 protein n=1 Tax=Candidatus Promineifilum breve TaxID=1806508 RepID=UPI0012FF8561|nr:glycosyltransferase family 2 protein [Candidatus Promineifilum breve]